MSKLGNVYELNFKTMCKNKYPIVYENKDWVVCKHNGGTDVKTFSQGGSRSMANVMTLDMYEKVIEKYRNGNDNPYILYVKVGHGVKYDFAEFSGGEIENQLSALLREKTYLERQMNGIESEIERQRINKEIAEKHLVNVNEEIEKLRKIISDKEKEEMKKGNNNDEI